MTNDLHLIVANKAYSSWSLRPWLAMKVHGLPFRDTVIPLQQEDTALQIRKFSRAGKVPVLVHGDVTVWDSLAILEYLADAFPEKPWWPEDSHGRAVARAVSAEMHSGFMALRSQMPMNLRKSIPIQNLSPEIATDVARISELWNDCRTRFGDRGPFLFGDFSNADAMYAPVVTRFKTYGVIETLDSASQSYCAAILDLPAMKDWYATAAAETWVIPKYEL